MGVGDDREWTPVERWIAEQPKECGVCRDRLGGRELGYLPAMCERRGCPGPTDRVSVEVVPVSVVVGLRGEVERLRARERELEDALRLIAETDWVDAVLDPERPLRVARVVLASSSAPTPNLPSSPGGVASEPQRQSQDCANGSSFGPDAPPGEASSSAPTDTTCPGCGGTKFAQIMDPEAGACPRCSGSGRVTTTKEETCPDCRATGYCDRDACHVATKDQP